MNLNDGTSFISIFGDVNDTNITNYVNISDNNTNLYIRKHTHDMNG